MKKIEPLKAIIIICICGFLITLAISAKYPKQNEENGAREALNETTSILKPEIEQKVEETIREPKELFVVITKHKEEKSERFLWEALSKYSPNNYVTAGVMAYFWRESQFRSDATAGWGYDAVYKGIDRPAEFTSMIDNGIVDGSTRDLFLEQARKLGGYGLGQWYSIGYLEAFYDFASKWGTSIADAEMQCAFTIDSFRENNELWEQLQNTDDPAYAGRLIARLYDGVTEEANYFGVKAKEFYEKYVEEEDAMPQMQELYVLCEE